MDDAASWLARARSSLRLAESAEGDEGIALEDRSFQLQQAAEKAIKALLIHMGVEFPRTHDLVILLRLAATKVKIPDEIGEVVNLNGYAVQTRYPGDYEPVGKIEYADAKTAATRCVDWAARIITKPENTSTGNSL